MKNKQVKFQDENCDTKTIAVNKEQHELILIKARDVGVENYLTDKYDKFLKKYKEAIDKTGKTSVVLFRGLVRNQLMDETGDFDNIDWNDVLKGDK